MKDLIGLAWEDVDKQLDSNERRQYSQDAQLILGSKIWQNEVRYVIDQAHKTAFLKAGTMDEVRDMQMCVAGIRLIEARLQEISQWSAKEEKPFDPSDPI